MIYEYKINVISKQANLMYIVCFKNGNYKVLSGKLKERNKRQKKIQYKSKDMLAGL